MTTNAFTTSRDGVATVHVSIGGTEHELSPDDASSFANQVKDAVPSVVRVDGHMLTISMGFDAMSCHVKQVIDALEKARLIPRSGCCGCTLSVSSDCPVHGDDGGGSTG